MYDPFTHSKGAACMKRPAIAVAVALVSVSSVAPAAAQANLGGAPGNCDKACLTGIADAYFAALVAHDPSKAPMAPGAKATENTQAVNIGDGLWKDAGKPAGHDEAEPVRLRIGPHPQDPRWPDSRDRGNGHLAAAPLEERVERVLEVGALVLRL